MTGRVVVIGVGNAWRRDDGAGLEAVRRAAPRLAPGVAVCELDGEPARVVDAWDGATVAVLVDAVRTGAAPGTVHQMDMTDATPVTPARAGSSHALGPVDAYRLGRALDRVPARVVLLGIEVADVGPGAGLSPAVDAAVSAAADEIVALVAHAQAVRSP